MFLIQWYLNLQTALLTTNSRYSQQRLQTFTSTYDCKKGTVFEMPSHFSSSVNHWTAKRLLLRISFAPAVSVGERLFAIFAERLLDTVQYPFSLRSTAHTHTAEELTDCSERCKAPHFVLQILQQSSCPSFRQFVEFAQLQVFVQDSQFEQKPGNFYAKHCYPCKNQENRSISHHSCQGAEEYCSFSCL